MLGNERKRSQAGEETGIGPGFRTESGSDGELSMPKDAPIPHRPVNAWNERNSMSHDSLAWIDEELAILQQLGLRRQLSVRDGPQSPVIRLDDTWYVNFGCNDYLGLAGEVLRPAVALALAGTGWGSGASPLITGRARGHAELEAELADFEGTEAALLFTSGYAANVGTIGALVGAGDAVFSDAKNHASIIDGCRLSRADVCVYPHGDLDFLADALRADQARRRRLIVSDSLFSMDGDGAPLVELVELAERHAAMLMVDEAHATGVFGASGRGWAEQLRVEERIPVRVGTLSKALGSVGGFVVGSRRLIDWLANRARSFIYSTAGPEVAAVAGLEALRRVRCEPWRRQELLARATGLRGRLRQAGWNIGTSCSQIIPIILGDAAATMHAAQRLRELGLLVPGIRPPTVPAGESLLRVSLTAGHSEAMVEQLLRALESVARE